MVDPTTGFMSTFGGMFNFGSGGGAFGSIGSGLSVAWTVVSTAFVYLWWLIPVGFAVRWKKKWQICAFTIVQRGNSQGIRIDFGQIRWLKKPGTIGIGTRGIYWRSKKRFYEMIPTNCLWGGSWGFFWTILREGVNGELIPVTFKGDECEVDEFDEKTGKTHKVKKMAFYMMPLDADIEALRQQRYDHFNEIHNTTKVDFWKTQTFWNIVLVFGVGIALWLILGKIGDIVPALDKVSTVLAKALEQIGVR